MLIYELYRTCIKNGDGEYDEYFAFICLALPAILVDICLSPFEILTFIVWKIKTRRTKSK